MKSSLYNMLVALCITLAVTGTGVLVGVWAVPQWDAYRAETQMASMQVSSVGASSSGLGSEQLSEAHSYNASLAGEIPSSSSTTAYDRQLTLLDSQAISWLHIPSIDVRRPVYRYDNERVLMQGLGHIEGTSLPVGGESTHCCVTGHSGMLGSRMFDDLDKVRIGDVFVFWTLGDPYAYRVYDIEVVEPNDTSSLYIQPGRDLATLITCTPYGINSHRLLVHGERTDYVPEEMTISQHPTSNRIWVLALGIAAAAGLVGLLLYALLGGSSLKLATVAGGSGGVIWHRGAANAAGAAGGDGLASNNGAAAGGDAPGAAATGGNGGTAASGGAAESGEMRIDLKVFGRAEVVTDAGNFNARWHRDPEGDIVIDLAQGGMEELISTDGGGTADVQVPQQLRLHKVDGAYTAEATVDGAIGTLTFDK